MGVVGALNLAGCLVAGGSPLFLKDYFDFLAAAHKSVEFNRAALNPQITSWNRIIIAAGGPVVELTALTTLAGYLVWYGLVVGRCVLAGRRPSPAWALAASAVGALVCCQVLGYEVFLLALVVPYLRELLEARRIAPAAVVLGLIAVQLVPFDFEAVGVGAPRALGAVGVAIMLLFSRDAEALRSGAHGASAADGKKRLARRRTPLHKASASRLLTVTGSEALFSRPGPRRTDRRTV